MLGYLLVPYLTRVMTTGEYGVYTHLYSLIPLALVLLTMGLENGYFRFAGKTEDEAERNALFATLLAATAIAAAVFCLAVSPFSEPIASSMGYGDHASYVWLTAIIISLDAITAIPFARLRQQRRRMRYVTIRLVSVVVNLALCGFFYTAQGRTGVEWVLWANVAASAVSLAMLLPTMRWLRLSRVDPKLLKRVMVFSLPLLVSGVAGTAGEFVDRQMVKWLMPPDVAMEALGVYGAATKLAVIMILFTTMYRLAAEPIFLAKFGRRGDFARQSMLALWLYIGVAVLIFAAVMIGKPLVVLILGEQFREGSHLLPVLLAANALAGVVFSLSFWYKQAERTWVAIAITGTGLAAALALNLVLVPRMGYEGAAWARLGCEAAMVAVSVGLLYMNRKKIREL
jgi:O-antigen/teichoic acid export membrane protein